MGTAYVSTTTTVIPVPKTFAHAGAVPISVMTNANSEGTNFMFPTIVAAFTAVEITVLEEYAFVVAEDFALFAGFSGVAAINRENAEKRQDEKDPCAVCFLHELPRSVLSHTCINTPSGVPKKFAMREIVPGSTDFRRSVNHRHGLALEFCIHTQKPHQGLDLVKSICQFDHDASRGRITTEGHSETKVESHPAFHVR